MNLHRRAITLLEVLIVVVIVGVLMALLLPAVQAAREAARNTECKSHVKQLGLSLQNYHTDHNMFPAALGGTTSISGVLMGGSHHSPHARLLPYLGLSNVYNALNFEFPYDLDPFDGWPIGRDDRRKVRHTLRAMEFGARIDLRC